MESIHWHEDITNHDRATAGLVGVVAQAKAPDRIVRVRSDVRRGLFRLTCRRGDTGVAGSGDNHRCELYVPGGPIGKDGTVEWWAWSQRPISGPMPTNGFSMRAQWHTAGGGTQAPIALSSLGGRWDWRIWNSDTERLRTNLVVRDAGGAPVPARNGPTLNIVQRVGLSSRKGGALDVWVNGVLAGSVRDWCNVKPGTSGSYPKFGGIYTNVAPPEGDPYVSEVWGIRRGTSGNTVASMAAGFEPGSGFVVPVPVPVPVEPALVDLLRGDLRAIAGRLERVEDYRNLTDDQRARIIEARNRAEIGLGRVEG